MKKLSPSARVVFTAIVNDPQLRTAPNSVLAKRVGRHPRSVGRGLDELVDSGQVVVTYRRAHGPGDAARIISIPVTIEVDSKAVTQ